MAKLDELPMVNSVASVLAHTNNRSLVLGEPLYQLYLRTRLAKPPLDLLLRRLMGLSPICWLPLLALSVLGGRALGCPLLPITLTIIPLEQMVDRLIKLAF